MSDWIRGLGRVGTISLLACVCLLPGCTTRVRHAGYGTWDDAAKELGPVSVCRGGQCHGTDEGAQWPLSLTHPPDPHTYYSALVEKAAKIYNVPTKEIVLGEVDVQIYAEIVGTVRGWKASAAAARRATPEVKAEAPAAPSAEERLIELKRLRDQGLLTDDEYEVKRDAIVDQL